MFPPMFPQRSRIINPESEIRRQNEALKEESMEMIEEGQEMIKEVKGEIKTEEVAKNQGKEALQKLLDEALTLYRDGIYSEAITKWEEVLVIDPENIEAKFNIEIAKEKMKPPAEK